MRATDLAETTLEELTRAVNALPASISLMAEAASPLRAAAYDVAGNGAQAWCWEHEREVWRCHADELDCGGEVIDPHDPTGEAAMQLAEGPKRPSSAAKAQADLRAITKALRAVQRNTDALTDILARWQPSKVVNDTAGIGPCSDCRTYCDGVAKRLSRYKGGDLVCHTCRVRRDREAAA